MKHKNYEKHIESIAQRVMPNLLDNIIIDTDDGYVLFNKFHIIKNYDNTYSLLRSSDDEMLTFSKLKYATAYAILYHYSRLYEANRICDLDVSLGAIEVELALYKKLKNRSNTTENSIIYNNKIQFATLKQKQFLREIDKYINTADYCQQRGYRNELNRTERR